MRELNSLGIDVVPHEVQEQNILPPLSPDDERGWELYNRALRGDKSAEVEYVNRDEFKALEITSEVIRSARKLGIKTKTQLSKFTEFTKKLSKSQTGAVNNVTDALNEGSRIIKGMEIVPTRTIGKHTLQRMGERGITESMVDKALQKGKRFWDPKNKTVNYVLEEGFASGKTLLVGQNIATGKVTTVIRGNTKKLLRPRHIEIPNK